MGKGGKNHSGERSPSSEIYRKIDYELIDSYKPSYISLEKALEFMGLFRGASLYFGSYETIGYHSSWGIRLSSFTALFQNISPSVNLYCCRKSSPRLFISKRLKSHDFLEKCVFKIVKSKQSSLIAYAQRFQKPGILTAAKALQQYLITQKGYVKLQ